MTFITRIFGTPSTLSPLEEAMIELTNKAEHERIHAIGEAVKAYNGAFTDPLVVADGEPNDNVKVNLIKPLVDATVNYLMGTPPEIEIPAAQDGEGSSAELSPEEAWLEECLRLNAWPEFLLDLAQNGALAGTAYYALDTDEPYPNAKEPLRVYPQFYCIDPAAMRIRTDPYNIRKATRYEWRYNDYDPKTGRPVIERKVYIRDEGGQGWTIHRERSFVAGMSTQAVALYGGLMEGWQQVAPSVSWPKPWPPIGHIKNLPTPNQVYGPPDVTETLIESNKAVNFNLSNRMRIDKHHGHPKVWIINYQGELNELDTSIGNILNIPSAGSDPVSIGQLVPAVDSTPAALLKREITDSMLEESGTPSITLGMVDAAGVPSGVALKMRIQPMLNKTKMKHTMYDPALIELIRRLFELGGFESDIIVGLTWLEPVPVDMVELRTALKMDMDAGALSVEGYASKVGIDWETEKPRLDAERTEGDKRMLESQKAAMQARADTFGVGNVAQNGSQAQPVDVKAA